MGDFELKAEFKIEGGNSGIQYRSFEVPNAKWVIGGYQADIDSNPSGGFTGIVYGEKFRGILAQRGTKATVGDDHKAKETGKIGDPTEILKTYKRGEWNEYHITGQGFHFVQKINGVTHCRVDRRRQRTTQGDRSARVAIARWPADESVVPQHSPQEVAAGQSSLNAPRSSKSATCRSTLPTRSR